jgi:hypothetical protein
MKKSVIKKAIDEQHVQQLLALFPRGGNLLSKEKKRKTITN